MSDAYRDGEQGVRARLDDLVWQRDVLWDKRLETERELARVQEEIASLRACLTHAARVERRSWLWLLAIPVGFVGLWVVAFAFWTPRHGSRVESAKVGAEAVRQAAELYVNTEDDRGCPTSAKLVAAKLLDRKKLDDPWGHPYQIACEGEDIRITSAGKDGRLGSADDIRDDFKPSDIKRVAALND